MTFVQRTHNNTVIIRRVLRRSVPSVFVQCDGKISSDHILQ